jgi:hypothetical protein
VIAFYTFSGFGRIYWESHYNVNYTQESRFVGPRNTILQHADNNMTFPALTINFFLPEQNLTDDPWEYILSQYSVHFRTDMFQQNYTLGVPCDTVKGYKKEILKHGDLNRYVFGEGINALHLISLCPPTGHLSYFGLANTQMTVVNSTYIPFGDHSPSFNAKFVSRQFEPDRVMNRTSDYD